MEAEIAALRVELAALRAMCPPGSIVIPPPDWQAKPQDVSLGSRVSITMYDAPDGVKWTVAVYDLFEEGEADLAGAHAKSWATLAEALGGVVVNHSPDAGKMVEAE